MTAPLPAPPGLVTRTRRRRQALVPALVVVLAAVAGFLLVGQLQGDRERTNPLEAEEEGDLARILAGLTNESDGLQAELADLRLQLNELRRSSESDAAAAGAIDQQIRTLEVLSGTTPVTGPGVVVVITDTGDTVGYDSMIDVVQELRDAGAEAIAINDQRIGVTTAFGERDGSISVNGEVIRAPYRVAAVGNASTLEGGLKIPGGAIDALSALGKSVGVTVTKQVRVRLPALARPPELDVARPVTSSP